MKKLVLMAVAIVAVSFASCGNKAADAAKAQQDSIRNCSCRSSSS